MGNNLYVSKETGTVYKPVWLSILEDIPGGITIALGRVPTTTTELKAGTLLIEGDTTGVYQPVKAVRHNVIAQTDTYGTIIYVEAGHLFKIGDYIGRSLAGRPTSSTIAVVGSNGTGSYITITNSIGSLNLLETLYEKSAGGANASVNLYIPTCVLKNDVEVREADGTTLYNILASAVVRGTVDESLMPYPSDAAMKAGLSNRIQFLS